jgi:hypothetical protein
MGQGITRRQLLWGAIALGGTQLITRPSQAARRAKITVSTSRELWEAIGSDRTIRLRPGVYDLVSIAESLTESSPHIAFEPVYDGIEAVIRNVQNLTIIGPKDHSAKIYTQPRYADVLRFDNCQDISIERVEAGHWPDAGDCNGAVLQFTDCDRIELDDLMLFGSGTYGIWALRTNELHCKDSQIYECTYGILYFTECEDIHLEDCQFLDNRKFNLVHVERSRQVQFEDCQFRNNQVLAQWDAFFNVIDSPAVLVEDCQFINNSSAKLMNQPGVLRLDDVDFTDNTFTDV